MKNLMRDLNLHFTDSQVQSHVLAIHGATRALMLAIINKQPSASLNDIYALIIRIALSEFSLPPPKKISRIIRLTSKIMQTKSFSRKLTEKLKS